MEHEHTITVVDIEIYFLQHTPGTYAEAIVVAISVWCKGAGHFEAIVLADIYLYLCSGAAAEGIPPFYGVQCICRW